MTRLLFQEYVQQLDQTIDYLVFLLVDSGPHGIGNYLPQYVKIIVFHPNTKM